jgi:hypothetical protein
LAYGQVMAPFYGKLTPDQVHSSIPITRDPVLIGSVEVVSIPPNNGFVPQKFRYVYQNVRDLEPNVVGSRTVFTFIIIKFTAK